MIVLSFHIKSWTWKLLFDIVVCNHNLNVANSRVHFTLSIPHKFYLGILIA